MSIERGQWDSIRFEILTVLSPGADAPAYSHRSQRFFMGRGELSPGKDFSRSSAVRLFAHLASECQRS